VRAVGNLSRKLLAKPDRTAPIARRPSDPSDSFPPLPYSEPSGGPEDE
jgi:hypothetical protein